MPTIYLRLDPRKLENPDLDLRYVIPDLIAERSCGLVKGDGYDYVGDVPYLLLFLKTTDIEQGLLWVLSTLEHEVVMGNDILRASVVAVERDERKVVEYPKDFQGAFPA
jgi:hypothetical protein